MSEATRKGPKFALTTPLATEVLGAVVRVVNADGDDLAVIGEADEGDNRKIADLFAAAPDLYAALQQMVEAFGGVGETTSPALQRASAALAKARGETP